MNILKQSTAATIKLGPFVDDGDGKTAETGLTISQADIRLSKNGGDIAQSHNTAGATHDELGYYNIPLDTTDTGTLGRLRVLISKAGALPVWQDFLIVTANVFDTFCSTDKLEVELATGHGLATATALQTVDDNVDAILVDTGTTLDTLIKDIPTTAEFEARTLVAANYFDPAADTVKLNATQGAVTFGQVKITANVSGEGALHIVNSNATGVGQYNKGESVGMQNIGDGDGGMRNESANASGMANISYAVGRAGLYNSGGIGMQNDGTGFDVQGFDPALALESTLTAMKGAGWTDETLVALMTAIEAISGGSGATAQEVWEYATRTLTGLPTMPADWVTASGLKADAVTEIQSGLAKTTDIPSDYAKAGDAMTLTAAYDNAKDDVLTPLATVDSIVDAIKAKTDNLPASPAATGAAMTLTSAYDAAKTAATQASVNAIPTTPLLAANYTAPDNASITAIKAKTDNLPADPADDSDIDTQLAAIKTVVDAVLVDTGTTLDDLIDTEIAAIKAKTDLIPATPAQAGEYTSALSAIQADLDNPSQYKADVSGLATSSALATVDAVVDGIATTLATPATFKADVSGLATSTELSAIDDKIDTLDTVADGIATTLASPDNFKADVSALALESTLTAIKGAGWSTETLAAIKSAIDALSSGGVDPAVIAAAILDALLADHTVAGSVAKTIADILEDTGTTLSNLITAIKSKTDLMDASAITYTPNVVGTDITLLRGDTFSATLTDVGALTGYVSIDFTVKRNTSNTDDEAVIRIRKNASGTGDGLLRLNRAAPTTETGEIVIDDEATGDITITLDETATDSLEIGAYLYDVQLITATAVKTLTSGRLNVTSDVTRAIV